MNGQLVFGVYPGSALGDDVGGIVTGPPDQPDAINDALSELQGPAGRQFIVRAYRAFGGKYSLTGAPEGCERYLDHGRRLNLVAQYHSTDADIDGYCAFIEELVDAYTDRIATLQVCEEPNVTTNPALDGCTRRSTRPSSPVSAPPRRKPAATASPTSKWAATARR